MSMMAPSRRAVTGGVDAHTDTRHGAVLDQQGRLLGTKGFPADARGYRQLANWLVAHGEVRLVGVVSRATVYRALERAGIHTTPRPNPAIKRR